MPVNVSLEFLVPSALYLRLTQVVLNSNEQHMRLNRGFALGEAIKMYREGENRSARQLSGLLAREFARQAPEAFSGQAGQVVVD